MHELSIIENVVEAALEAARAESATRVTAVQLRVGVLAGVVRGALEFCYEVATRGTLLEGSALVITELPVVIQCSVCGEPRTLPGVQSFRCPVCGTPGLQLLQGRELEIASIEIESAAAAVEEIAS